ncbi:MAG TPA: PhoPQ-activated protein PqaA family protein [Candidatus Hydrogenedens sp.]|nr:PhoPQ-activated protein PqaA family protein [Candidatus Hydrogenedens sp.]
MSSLSGDIPSHIGVYRIDERIAEGGFGVVYRGFDPRLKREVAIKVLHPQHSSEPSRVSRFLREAQSAARLNYPGIVQIYDIVEENQRLALVMEYVNGKNLDRYLREHPNLSLVERIGIGVQIAEALYLAHQAGIVHRDVKPANILVDENGIVKLTDFNLARLRDTSLTPLTGEHNVLGTPAYMSPEQCLGKEATPQSDLYSLGVVLYFIFTGSLPFEADNYLALMRQHTDTPPTPVRLINPDLPVALEKLISQCLTKNPEGRPATGKEVAERLREIEKEIIKHESGETPLAQQTMVLKEEGVPGPEHTTPLREIQPNYPLTPPSDSQRLQKVENTYAQPVDGSGAVGDTVRTPPMYATPAGQGTPMTGFQPTPSPTSGMNAQIQTPTPTSAPPTGPAYTMTPVPPSGSQYPMNTPYSPIPGTMTPIEVATSQGSPSGLKNNVLVLILLLISLVSLMLSGFMVYTYYHGGLNRESQEAKTTSTALTDKEKPEYDYSKVLSDYLKNSDDDNYHFEVYGEKQGEGYKAYFLDLTSQSWHPEKTVPPLWRHWLTVIVPKQRVKDIGMMVLTEGFSTSEVPMSDVPPYFISLAVFTKSVVAILEGFPRDNVGFYETPTKVTNLTPVEFINRSLQQYFETHDPGWIVFCPIVKSIVKAMDAIQDFFLKNLRSEIPVKEFVLCGDAPFFVPWLVPAVDKRVIGVAGINNFSFNIEQQVKRFLLDEMTLPALFAEMDDAGILALFEAGDGEHLLQVIDPYYYRSSLNIPKLIISLGTEASNHLGTWSEQMISDIPEPTCWVVYPHVQMSREYAFLPQQIRPSYALTSSVRLYDFKDTIQVFYQRILGQRSMPVFRWHIGTNGECTVKVGEEAVECRLWFCSKDKRGDIFEPSNKDWKCKLLTESAEGTYRTNISLVSHQYNALFFEVIFPSLIGVQFPLTSNIHVIPPSIIRDTVDTPSDTETVTPQ